MRELSIVEAYWARVVKDGPLNVPELGPCWEWEGAFASNGYPRTPSGKRGRYLLAHRVSLSLKLGRPIAEGMHACHRCDYPPCTRPDHLYEGTDADNVKDAVSRGRHKKGGMDPAAKLTDDMIIAIRTRAANGEKNRALAAEYGVAESLISGIIRGSRWKHVGGPISQKYRTKEK